MEHCYILRHGEISLRGNNRRMYEDYLENNVKKMLSYYNASARIKRLKGRMVLITENRLLFLKRIFGIISISEGYRVKRNAEEINEILKKLNSPIPKIKFSDKGKEDTELIKKISIGKNGIAYVEIYPENAFVYLDKEKAAGGLPVGCEGKVIVEIYDDKSILSALLMMKRGCDVIPFTEKTISLALLKDYGCYNEPIKNIGDVKGAIAIVSKEKSLLPKLNPLTGMSDAEIAIALSKFRHKSPMTLQS